MFLCKHTTAFSNKPTTIAMNCIRK